MQDEQIIELYWQRSESAIQQTQCKYGRYLAKIAYNVLPNWQDSEESVNETYLKAWNSMPPHRPGRLSTYLGKITRQVSIDIFRRRTSKKRAASEYALSLSELEECVSGGDTTVEEAELHRLAASIDCWLRTLPRPTRNAFVGRYYFMDSLRDVAGYCGMSEAKAKSVLYRARQSLRNYLEQEGFEL